MSGEAPLPVGLDANEERLVAELRAGSEEAFAALVGRYHASMVRVATAIVGNRAVAEEVAQDAWVGALRGIERFEGRSSLRTWLFRILTNRALSRQERERRSVPFSSLASDELDAEEAALDPERFLPADHARWPNTWAVAPESWAGAGEERALAAESHRVIAEAIDALPAAQRTVITMRDVEGYDAQDVCNALEVSETNQRVLLHRARSKVRRALEDYLQEDDAGDGSPG